MDKKEFITILAGKHGSLQRDGCNSKLRAHILSWKPKTPGHSSYEGHTSLSLSKLHHQLGTTYWKSWDCGSIAHSSHIYSDSLLDKNILDDFLPFFSSLPQSSARISWVCNWVSRNEDIPKRFWPLTTPVAWGVRGSFSKTVNSETLLIKKKKLVSGLPDIMLHALTPNTQEPKTGGNL